MSATDELRRLLDERDEYYKTSGNKTWWGRPIDRQTGKPINVFHYQAQPMGEDRLFVELQLATPEQAIAATLGRGTLTADDVRDLIERHSDASGGNGRDFHNGAYVAIADELNATLGDTDATGGRQGDAGTCHDTHEARWFRCSACGFGIEDMYVNDEDEYPPEDQPRYCPNCGRKRVDA